MSNLIVIFITGVVIGFFFGGIMAVCSFKELEGR